LRRTLFARGINSQSENSAIELVEAGSSREAEAARDPGKGKQSQTSINISSVHENESDVAPVDPSTSLTSSDPEFTDGTDKKTFGTLSLPNYDVWAKRQIQKRGWLRNVKPSWKKLFEGKQIPPSKDGRHIDLDASRQIQLIDERTGKPYIGNTIRSSRYTLWNFIPRQLFFQFSKLANAYFLLISIMQMIPGWSTTGNYTTIAPLLVFVAVSIAKEGYDDVRRYKLDQVENNRVTLALRTNSGKGSIVQHGSGSNRWASKARSTLARGSEARGHQTLPSNAESFSVAIAEEVSDDWMPLKWRDVKVGDIIKLQRDDPVPADMVLLHSDGVNGIAYIETMALDGETNLKSKQAPPCLAKRCGSEEAIRACRARIVVEDPNIDLYNFDGRVTVDGETLPLTTNEIVFRGSTLRNTSSAVGMIINSGEECKIRMNANKNPRIKAPAIQFITNKIIAMLVIFVVILAFFCTIAYQVWTETTEEKSWYLKGAHVPFVQIIVGFIILFNTLIPLSLYVSLEIIKVFQLILMGDAEMYDPVSDTPMTCNVSICPASSILSCLCEPRILAFSTRY
jgi:phospholipid-translocating ATPase